MVAQEDDERRRDHLAWAEIHVQDEPEEIRNRHHDEVKSHEADDTVRKQQRGALALQQVRV